jgi:hypothetical protein
MGLPLPVVSGARYKTPPSKLTGRELRALLATGKARPADAEPIGAPARMDADAAVEVERTVNAVELIGLGGARYAVGNALAGQRVILRAGRHRDARTRP